MFSLASKSILITGATGYLGNQMAISLADFGAHIYVSSRSRSKCEELVSRIEDNGGVATVASFDVTNEDEINVFAESIDVIDVLVNNCYAGNGGTVESSETADYESSYQSSLVASANLLKILLPRFRAAVRKGGYASVINISSMYGLVSPDLRIYESVAETNPPFYGAAKAALIQWTKYAACEFAKENIRVNCISPGPFPSNLTQENNPELVEKIVSKVPMERIGQPNELIGPIAFLASSASSYVTGANILVDGGWTCW